MDESVGKEKVIPCRDNQKTESVAKLISDTVDFQSKPVTGNKEGQYIMIKRSILQPDITIVNTYAPNIEAPKT